MESAPASTLNVAHAITTGRDAGGSSHSKNKTVQSSICNYSQTHQSCVISSIDGKFVCPLGGEYELFAPGRDLEVWVSSALPPENRFLLTDVPEDFQFPLLDWFRGLRGDLQYQDDALSLHLEIEMAPGAVPQ